MKCIIIEDNELSRRVLEEFIKKTDNLNLVASFQNAIDAINHLGNKEKVDLVFLDIELPQMSGVEFLESLKSSPQVIITSSKEKYAIQAFNFNVTDYLLKPIRYPRFYKAVDKAFKMEKLYEVNRIDDEIFIKKGSSLIKLAYDNIIWIEALENYVILNTEKGKYTIHFTMKAMEKTLPRHKFLRIHRSYIIHLRKISSIQEKNVELSYSDKIKTLPIGKSYKDRLLKEIKTMK
ncbi:MAG TPA: response regulator transcription factor [Bacteroidetes bacterium]|nr:response regulator transcription factor [Bacteroidota bacterium]